MIYSLQNYTTMKNVYTVGNLQIYSLCYDKNIKDRSNAYVKKVSYILFYSTYCMQILLYKLTDLWYNM